MTPEGQANRVKINKQVYTKLKSFFTAKEIINKILANNMTEKIYKQLIQLNNNKKQTTQLKNGQKTKEDMQMANRHIKRCSSLLIIRETQIKTTVT